MRVLIRGQSGSLRTPMSFLSSAGIHGSILAWLALSPQPSPEPRRLTMYEQQIQPNEKHIVWYNLRDRLPDVSPAQPRRDARRDPRPPRARRRFDQDIVAGAKDKAGSSQMIFAPAPEIRTAKPLPLPNVVAVSVPARPVRTFTPPPEASDAAPAIPDAPAVSPAVDRRRQPLAAPPARPLKTFTPPAEPQRQPAKLTLPEAPRVGAVVRDENLPLDFANPRVKPRAFAPPPAPPVRTAPVVMLEAPGIVDPKKASNLPSVIPNPRAPLKRFDPPPAKAGQRAAAPAELPSAPEVSATVQARNLPVAVPNPRAPLKRFNAPPATAAPATSRAELPAAPEVAATVHASNLPLALPDPRAPLRRFNPPPAKQAPAPSKAELPAAPEVAATTQARTLPLALPDPRAPLKRFNPPTAKPAPSTAEIPAAPTVASASGNAETTLAIVGLNPTTAPDFPKPPGSREAGFSAGPKPNKQGSDSAANDGTLVVPWLTARGGAKDNQPTIAVNSGAGPDPSVRENLLAAARSPMRAPFPDAALPRATRVSNAPDPRLQGRAVYSIAIQMPNVTSYSGSWIVWFSERQPVPGAPPPEVRAPVPRRKVDPKYIAEAVQERVEGTVRLFAVIRQDGHVESVTLLRHLDDRLDQSAQEALAKWIFEPALRNGTPMDVEAVFEIPFRLAPRTLR